MRSGARKIKGTVIEAIIGAVFLEFGSAAAQRLFHSRILPALTQDLRDPYLIERAEELKGQVADYCGAGGFVLGGGPTPAISSRRDSMGMETTMPDPAVSTGNQVEAVPVEDVVEVLRDANRKQPDLSAEVSNAMENLSVDASQRVAQGPKQTRVKIPAV